METVEAFHDKYPNKPVGDHFEKQLSARRIRRASNRRAIATVNADRSAIPIRVVSNSGHENEHSRSDINNSDNQEDLNGSDQDSEPSSFGGLADDSSVRTSPLEKHLSNFLDVEVVTKRSILVFMAHLHLLSRKLKEVPTADKWKHISKPVARAWQTKTHPWAEKINSTLDQWEVMNRTTMGDDAITKLTMEVLSLPTLIILPAMNFRVEDRPFIIDNIDETPLRLNTHHQPGPPPSTAPSSHPDHLDTLAGKDPQTTRAVKLALAGHWGQAAKSLFSHGVAGGSKDLAGHIEKLHPSRDNPPRQPPVKVEQDHVTTLDILTQMKKNTSSSIDVFGFRADFLVQIVNTAFGTALPRLLALFANCKLP